MMLTPEQLAERLDGYIVTLRKDIEAINGKCVDNKSELLILMLARIDAQQVRIAELEKDAARLDFIERMAKQSRTGVGVDWVRHVEDGFVTDHGYRVMWHHTLNDRKRDMRSAIDTAMQSTLSEDASDYGSRIAVIGQNGATGEHYEEDSKQ